LCVSELATNAVLHSNSGQPGGSFIVRAAVHGDGRLRIEVTDQGGPWAPRPDHDAGHGRGLLIVGRLAANWGITGDGLTSRTAWFELDCPEPPGSTARSDQHGGSARPGKPDPPC
jgi:two-component sensor histidine kinase